MNNLQKGAIVLCSISNDLGKIRPAIIVQNSNLIINKETIIVCPLTTKIVENSIARPIIYPNTQTNTKQESQIMIDKLCSIKKKRIKSMIGNISQAELLTLDNALKLWLDLE